MGVAGRQAGGAGRKVVVVRYALLPCPVGAGRGGKRQVAAVGDVTVVRSCLPCLPFFFTHQPTASCPPQLCHGLPKNKNVPTSHKEFGPKTILSVLHQPHKNKEGRCVVLPTVRCCHCLAEREERREEDEERRGGEEMRDRKQGERP